VTGAAFRANALSQAPTGPTRAGQITSDEAESPEPLETPEATESAEPTETAEPAETADDNGQRDPNDHFGHDGGGHG
jgi:hypothetical protein